MNDDKNWKGWNAFFVLVIVALLVSEIIKWGTLALIYLKGG